MSEAKRGDRVSLNLIKRLYYFQGEGGVNLGENDRVSMLIPATVTDHQLKQINHAINNEQLIIGYAVDVAEEMDKDSDLKKLISNGRNKVLDWVSTFERDKAIKTSDKVSKLEKLLKFEKESSNRVKVVETVERVLSRLGGISAVEETDQEAIEIKLTSGSDEEEENKG